MIIDLTFMNN